MEAAPFVKILRPKYHWVRKLQAAFGNDGQEGGKDRIRIRVSDGEHRKTERRELLASVVNLGYQSGHWRSIGCLDACSG